MKFSGSSADQPYVRCAIVIFLTFAAAGLMKADTITTFQMTGTNWFLQSVAAQIVFDMNSTNHTMTVTVTNQKSGQTSGYQAITGVQFGLSAGSATLANATGDLVNVGWFGSVTDQGNGSLPMWNASTSLGTVSLTDSSYTETVLGAPSGGYYSGADGTMAASFLSNPFVSQTATFTFTGVTGNLVANSVQVGFGMTGDFSDYLSAGSGSQQITGQAQVEGGGGSTPEPGTLLTTLGGVCLIGIGTRRKRLAAGRRESNIQTVSGASSAGRTSHGR